MDAEEFEDANAACGLLPGPASTQLAIFCAYRVAGPLGAIVGGLGFVVPAVVLVLLLSVVFFGAAPPLWIRGAGAGAGAAVAAVAVDAARSLLAPSYQRVRADRARLARWALYLAAAAVGAALAGPYLVLVLIGCGLTEFVVRRRPEDAPGLHWSALAALAPRGVAVGGLGALCWTAFKVGALSYGGGFVIVPLMQADAVHTYHWMTSTEFLNAVALGQVTPGPGRCDDRGRRLRGARPRSAACSRQSSPSRRRSRSSCSEEDGSSVCATVRMRGRSWTEPGRRPSARSSAPRSR